MKNHYQPITFVVGSLGAALVVAAMPGGVIVTLLVGWTLMTGSFAMYAIQLRSDGYTSVVVALKASTWMIGEILISHTANLAVLTEIGKSTPAVYAINAMATLLLIAALLLINFELWIIRNSSNHDIN
jgi:pheromone shutdown protein TraB